MAITDGDIVLDLRLDDKDFVISVRNSGKILRELRGDLQRAADGADKTQRHFNSLTTDFRHFVMSAAAIRFALMDIYDVFFRLPTSILKTSGEMERLTKLMQGLSSATTEAGKAQEAMDNTDFILGLAKNAPFEINALADAFVKFKSGGLDPTNGSLQALIDSVARFGGDSQALHRSAVAIQQMAGKGVISMEELRQQLGEAVPDAMKLMAQGMGMSMAELTKKVSLGAVESTDALRRMFTMMEFQNRGAALEMMDTWTGLTSRLKTEWTILQNEIGKSAFSDSVKTQIKDLINVMGSEEGVIAARQFGAALAGIVEEGRNAFNILRENWEMIKLVGQVLLIAFAGSKLKQAFDFFTVALQKQKQLFKETADVARLRRQQAVAELQLEAQSASEKVMRDQSEIASSKAKYATLKVEHAKYLAEIRTLNKANEAFSKMGASSEITAIIAQNKEKIKQLREQDRETKKLMQSEKDHQSSVSSGLIVSRQAAAAKESIAKSAAEAAAKMGFMATAGAGLRVALSALGGPIGIVTAALSIGIPMWMQWGNAGEKAIQKIRDALNSNTSSQETIDLINTQLAKKRKELDEFNNDAKGFSLLPKTANDVQEEIAQRRVLEEEIRTLEENLITAKEQRTRNAAESSIRTQRTVFQQEIDEAAAHHRAMAREIQDSAARKLEGVKKGSVEEIRIEEEKNKAIQKTVQDFSDKQIEILEKHRREASKRLEIAKKGGDAAQIKGAQAHLDELTDESIQKSVSADLKRFQKDAHHLTDPNNMKVEKEKKPDPLQQALEKSRGDLEAAKIKMDDLLDGAITFDRLREATLAKLMGQRAAGQFNVKDARGNSVKPGANDERFKETASNVAKIEQVERERQVQRALVSLTAQSVQERQNALERFSSSEFYDQESTGVRRLERQLVKLKETLVMDDTEEGRQALENFKKTSEQIVSDQAVADLLNFTAGFKRAREEIEVGLQDTDIGRKKAAYALEMNLLKSQLKQREDAIKANSRLTSDEMTAEIKRASEEAGLYIAKLAEQQERALRSPLQSLSKEWEDVTARMRQASVRWSNDTIDSIVGMVKTGKFEWRDLADTILTDIARISLQKGIGGALNSIFDTGVNMIAGLFGADTTMANDKLPIDPGTGAVKVIDATNIGSKVSEAVQQKEIFKTANEKLSSMWDGISEGMNNTWEGLKSMLGTLGDGLGNLVSGLGSALSSFLSGLAGGGSSILSEVIGVVANIGSSFAGSMGGFSGSAGSGFQTASYTGYGGMGAPRAFANGGIMTPFGEVPLRKYANGGIANFPQLALYGEGKMAEAYVPLPDGRTIPVTMTGAVGGQNVMISIVVNNDGTEENKASGSDTSVWNSMAGKIKNVVREELMIQKRPGGVLAK